MVAGTPPPGGLLRRGLPRDPQAVPHLVALTVSAVATVVLTRAYLAASGYPQLGGGGLHIAHMLWGGLLMLATLVVLLSFAGPAARPLAAVVGGIGFGLFIDEVGKFVTADNDYFYEPAAAIMYGTLVLLVLTMHALHGRRAHHPAEHLAAAVDIAVAGVAGGFSPERRARAVRELRRAGAGVPGAVQVAALVDAVAEDPAEAPDPVARAGELFRRASHRVLAARFTGVVAVVLLGLEAAANAGYAAVSLVWAVRGHPLADTGESVVPVVGVAVGGALAAVLTATGFARLRRARLRAFQWFQRAVLANLLLTQVFQFAASELLASTAVLVDLALLTVIAGELDRLRTQAQPLEVAAAVGRGAASGASSGPVPRPGMPG